MTKQKIAVMGCGLWGRNIVRNFYNLEVLDTVCDLDEENLAKVKEQYRDVVGTIRTANKRLAVETSSEIDIKEELKLKDNLASKADRIELTNYYRKVDVDQLLDDKIGQDDLNEYSVYFTGKLSDYVTKAELADYALEIEADSEKYALKTDLNQYVLKSELPDIVIPGTGDGYTHRFLEETEYNAL